MCYGVQWQMYHAYNWRWRPLLKKRVTFVDDSKFFEPRKSQTYLKNNIKGKDLVDKRYFHSKAHFGILFSYQSSILWQEKKFNFLFLRNHLQPSYTYKYYTFFYFMYFQSKGLITFKRVAPLAIIWNKFHAFHRNSFLPFFTLANGKRKTYFKWHLMVPYVSM